MKDVLGDLVFNPGENSAVKIPSTLVVNKLLIADPSASGEGAAENTMDVAEMMNTMAREFAVLKADNAAMKLQVAELISSSSSNNDGGNEPAVVNTALSMNMLLPNGTFRGNVRITSDAELVVMLPLLAYITEIDGDLYISSLSWLPTLDGILDLLERVAGTLTIKYCHGLKTLANALPNLAEIGKAFEFDGNTQLSTASLYTAFPLLETVDGEPLKTKANTAEMDDNGVYTGELRLIAADFVTKRDMLKALTKVTKQLNMNHLGLADLDGAFPNLTEVGKNLAMTSMKVQTITGAFPLLEKIGDAFSFTYNDVVVSMIGAFPLLTRILGLFQIFNNKELISLDGSFLALESVVGQFIIESNFKLESMNGGVFAKLAETRLGDFHFVGTLVKSMDGYFPLLASIAGTFKFIDNNQIETMDGAFVALSTVGSQFTMYNNDMLATLGTGFKSLSSIGGELYFYGNGDNGQGLDGRGNSPSNPGLISFCTSAKQKLCGLTSSYVHAGWHHGSDDCC